MQGDTAGDPMTGLKWTRRTTARIANELGTLGVNVSPRTVASLLKTMGFSLRVNHKKLKHTEPKNRDAQFKKITALRKRFSQDDLPIISVDTKKKELVGNFKNPGCAWKSEAVLVRDHDFRSEARGMAIPYGVYDLRANRGTLFVGTTHDTPEFAADCVAKWWKSEGLKRYPAARQLAILADGGGSNGPTCRAWKYALQDQLCNRHGVTVTVAHYPSGASKWNPIEHRLFSEISKNWAGRPLDSYETILNYISTTSTTTGLKVRARLIRKAYDTGIKISDAAMRELSLTSDATIPKWNYTLTPA